jgi:hypothetical protein
MWKIGPALWPLGKNTAGPIVSEQSTTTDLQKMANVPLTPKQARKKLHRIVEQYGLDIGEIELIPIERIREALHRFDIGLLPSRSTLH